MPATVNAISDALDVALSHLMQLEASPNFKLHTRTPWSCHYTLRTNDPACPMPITKGFESRKAWNTRFDGVRVVDDFRRTIRSCSYIRPNTGIDRWFLDLTVLWRRKRGGYTATRRTFYRQGGGCASAGGY
ncbi:hypothetical protein BC830DRAFT_1171752 [Chytriomyces sp. MP71]|nr:hypothetical protein BC830DRAFT_1171752 [Chytriomyces sp. MP71]